MATDDFETSSPGAAPVSTGSRRRASPLALLLAVALVTVGAMASVGVLCARFQNPPPAGPSADDAASKELQELATKHFTGWPAGRKPAAVVLLSGETHLYEEPCGCTRPLLGGLERRYNVVKFLRDQGVEVVPVDVGDVYYSRYIPGRPSLEEQTKLKYKKIMDIYGLMEYAAVGVGQHEFRYPLLNALADTVLNDQKPYKMLAANITDKNNNFPNMLEDTRVAGKNVKVGVVATIGTSVSDEISKFDKTVKFDANQKVLPAALKAINDQSAEVRVLLYQGSEDEAKALAQAIPSFDIILCLSSESEPPTKDVVVGRTTIVRVGHKGRFVGIAAFFRKPDKSLEMRLDKLPLGEEFATPKGQESTNPVLKIVDEYTKKVHDDDMLGKYPQVAHPMQAVFASDRFHPSFVGSERCKSCHEADYEKWDESKHHVSFAALEKAKWPAHRQFDGECVVCHTTGFGYLTGYRDEKRTPHLKEVGCESCHGPGSLHADQPKDKRFAAALSPWKTNPNDRLPNEKLEAVIDIKTCQKCHDADNDPKFKFEKFWPKIAHGPGAAKAKAAAKKE